MFHGCTLQLYFPFEYILHSFTPQVFSIWKCCVTEETPHTQTQTHTQVSSPWSAINAMGLS